jgi:hypothetical protein
MTGSYQRHCFEADQAEHQAESRRRHWQEAVNVEYFRQTGNPLVDDGPAATRTAYEEGRTPAEAVELIRARVVKHYAKVNNDL